MTLTAAGSGHARYALIAGIICAAAVLFGFASMGSTVHRDHVDHHRTPNLLQDSWQLAPPYARVRGASRPVEPRRSA
ncbi:hypothetical protein [Nocardia sp. NPDC020380]|uniref:hypothetical protein n=1 Tax=unclassified Nocardia TaxID=2637762 RepID=UPI0037A96E49